MLSRISELYSTKQENLHPTEQQNSYNKKSAAEGGQKMWLNPLGHVGSLTLPTRLPLPPRPRSYAHEPKEQHGQLLEHAETPVTYVRACSIAITS